MSDAENAGRQLSIEDATSDRPTTSVAIDERTHYAHVRYAATETPGVIWYDPRDGRERLNLDVDTSVEDLALDERKLTGLRLHGHRNVCGIVDPSERWVLERLYAKKVKYAPIGLDADPDVRVESYRSSEVFEDQKAARDAAAETCEVYAEAEWRDAVAARLGGDE